MPIEDLLRSICKFFWHKTQLNKRLDAEFQQLVIKLVDLAPIIRSHSISLAIHMHIVGENAVKSNESKPDLPSHLRELFLVPLT